MWLYQHERRDTWHTFSKPMIHKLYFRGSNLNKSLSVRVFATLTKDLMLCLVQERVKALLSQNTIEDLYF